MILSQLVFVAWNTIWKTFTKVIEDMFSQSKESVKVFFCGKRENYLFFPIIQEEEKERKEAEEGGRGGGGKMTEEGGKGEEGEEGGRSCRKAALFTEVLLCARHFAKC